MPSSCEYRPRRGWLAKFTNAIRGIGWGIRGQNSFGVHLACAAAVLVLAAVLHLSRQDWCLLLLCITAVLASEMFNSALEQMARVVDAQYNPQLGRALDIASAAVLLAAMGAAVVGLVTLLPPFLGLLSPLWQAR